MRSGQREGLIGQAIELLQNPYLPTQLKQGIQAYFL
jgi:hypothetical protein